MSYRFVRCVSKSACTEDGTHCRACGRSHEEIAKVRELTSVLANFAKEMDYENPEEFLEYVAGKALKKIKASGPA